jgi:transcriptional regulator with XRE-family HTH domain
MPRSTLSNQALPPEVNDQLVELGKRIRQARVARQLTLADLAARIFVTPKTLGRVEAGDPGVSLGVLASTLFALSHQRDLDQLLGEDAVAAAHQRARLPQRASARARFLTR